MKKLIIMLTLVMALVISAVSLTGCGAIGKTAYQLAVDNGFIGSEQNWIEDIVRDIAGSAEDILEDINNHERLALVINEEGNGYIVLGRGSITTRQIVIPSTYKDLPITAIADNAFSYDVLTGVTIPDSVKTIGASAFYNCSGLTNVTIPSGVTSIGASAFRACSTLTGVTFSNTNGWTAGEDIIDGNLLSNSSTAAEYLTTAYDGVAWARA